MSLIEMRSVELQPRPTNLQDFIEKEKLVEDSVKKSSFTLEDLSDDDELWVMEIPRTVDPTQLKGQTIQLGEKSKFNIGKTRYCAVNREDRSHFTCVYSTGKESESCKTVNLKPTRLINIRRKLSSVSNSLPQTEGNCKVPFPKNLRTRHPLIGRMSEEKSPRNKKKSARKLSNGT